MSNTFPALVAFGPSIEWLNDNTLDGIRVILLKTSHIQRLVNKNKILPQLWKTLVEFAPDLSNTSGLVYLQKLAEWLDSGGLNLETNARDHHQLGAANISMIPLTVWAQTAHYVDYLSKIPLKHSKSDILTVVSRFCTELLAACAVVSPMNDEESALRTRISLRLAVAIGAFVDLKEC